MTKRGWFNNSYGHKLASYGIQTKNYTKLQPNKYKYFDWKKDFENKSTINYAYRCISVMDDEQTRLYDDIQGWINSFVEEGMDPRDANEIKEFLIDLEAGNFDSIERDEAWNSISNILSKYITAPKMANGTMAEQRLWEAIVLGDWEWDRESVIYDLHDEFYDKYPTLEDAEREYMQVIYNLQGGYYNE